MEAEAKEGGQDMSLSTGKFVGITSIFVCFLHYLGLPSQVYSHGDIHERIVELTKQIEQDSTNAALYLSRGELYRYHRQWDEALSDYDRAFGLDPALNVVDLARGRMMLEAGWFERAKPVLDRYLVRKPDNQDALIARARVLRNLKQNLAAAVDYTWALSHSAEPRPEHFLERAQVLVEEGPEYVAEAIDGLDEGLRRLGQIVTLQLYAVELEVKCRNYDGAVQRLTSISKQAARKEKWFYRLGEVLRQAGRYSEAHRYYVEALSQIETLSERARNTKSTLALKARVRKALAEVIDTANMEDSNATL